MDEKMRLTMHNGRAGKNGTYSSKHPDRNFNIENADHIDPEREKNNFYNHCYKKQHPDMTFEEAEKKFYEQNFSESLQARNEKNIAARHPERVIDMDTYRTAKRTCPEEQIIQIGRKDQTIEPELLKKIAQEQMKWESENFPNFKILDYALHTDETTPHIHKRGVWVAHDEHGQLTVGQSKALAEMRLSAPDPTKKYSKHNNAKMTYTKLCREHLEQLCIDHGLDIETTPKEHSKTGLSLEEYKARQEQDKALQAQREVAQAQKELYQQREKMAQISSEMERAKKTTLDTKKELNEAKNELKTVKTEKANLERMVADQQAMDKLLKNFNKYIRKANAIGDRVSDGHIELKKPVFGKDDEVSLGSVQTASWELGSLFKELRPVAEKLQQLEKDMSNNVKNQNSYIEKRANELFAEMSEQLRRDAAQTERELKAAKEKNKEAEEYKTRYRDLKDNEENYIRGTAETAANNKLNELYKSFDELSSDSEQRMRDFCSGIDLQDGRTVTEAFDDHETELLQAVKRKAMSIGFDR